MPVTMRELMMLLRENTDLLRFFVAMGEARLTLIDGSYEVKCVELPEDVPFERLLEAKIRHGWEGMVRIPAWCAGNPFPILFLYRRADNS